MVAVGLVGLQSLLSDNFVAEKTIRQLKFCFVFFKKKYSLKFRSSGSRPPPSWPLKLCHSSQVLSNRCTVTLQSAETWQGGNEPAFSPRGLRVFWLHIMAPNSPAENIFLLFILYSEGECLLCREGAISFILESTLTWKSFPVFSFFHLCFWDSVSLCSSDWLGTHHASQVWVYKCAPPRLTYLSLSSWPLKTGSGF